MTTDEPPPRPSPIALPTRVYLDTAHWIRLAEGGADARAFESLISSGAVTPVLSFAHLSDIASNPRVESRKLVGEFLDRMRRRGTMLWIKALNTIAADEVQATYEREHLGRASVQQASPFSAKMVDSCDFKNHGDPARLVAAAREEDALGIVGMIERLCRAPKRPEYMEFRGRVPETEFRVRDFRRSRKRFTAGEARGFIAFIVEKAALVFSTPVARERFIAFVEVHCDPHPALELRLRYRQGRLLTNAPPEASDIEDYDHLAGLAYCDVAFADKRTRDVLRRAGATRLPLDNGDFDRWLRQLVDTGASSGA
jgi:hypothetical protein